MFLLSPLAPASSFTGVSETVQLPAMNSPVHHMETWLLGTWKGQLFSSVPASGELNSHFVFLLKFRAKFFTSASFLPPAPLSFP